MKSSTIGRFPKVCLHRIASWRCASRRCKGENASFAVHPGHLYWKRWSFTATRRGLSSGCQYEMEPLHDKRCANPQVETEPERLYDHGVGKRLRRDQTHG